MASFLSQGINLIYTIMKGVSMCKFVQSFIVILLFSHINIFAQDSPIEWGEIPLSDLQMNSFPDDSNATAVILCDYGETKFNNDFDLEYKRILRVKILNEKGYRWGSHSIYIYSGKNGEKLRDLEGVTYSLDDKGEIVETELDDDNIYDEEIGEDRKKYTFTMPALKPGCIIEIRYKIIAESFWYVRDWTFQNDEPTLWSEYRITYPQNISFACVTIGYVPWTINDYKETRQHFEGRAATLEGEMANCNSYRWAIRNAPAFRDEPYITTIDDYLNKVNIQLAAYVFPHTGVQKILSDWKTLVNELVDHKNFGEKIDPDEVEELTTGIIKDKTTPEEKMIAIYDWVKKSIVWTGENRVFASNDIDYTIDHKRGTSAEITLLLISMLKSAGLYAEPVILSTRSNGLVQDIYPIISQFNYVLAKVNIGIKSYYLDATDPYRPYDVLPVTVLNVKGLVIKKDNTNWVTLTTNKKNLDQVVLSVIPGIDGSIKANYGEKFGEYKSLFTRKKFSDNTDTKIAENLFKTESSGLNIDSVKITDKDSLYNPIKIEAYVSGDNYSQIGGEFIYLNPNLVHRITDNPFKSAKRSFPIDYAYPRGEIITTNVFIPEGYVLKEKPTNKSFSVGSSASYKRMVDVNESVIQFITIFEIKNSLIPPASYEQLKDFYAKVIAAQAEMFVFAPKGDATEVSGNGK